MYGHGWHGFFFGFLLELNFTLVYLVAWLSCHLMQILQVRRRLHRLCLDFPIKAVVQDDIPPNQDLLFFRFYR